MKIWFKIWKDTRLLRDTTVEDLSDDTRTHKIMNALDQVCHEFDLMRPTWLHSTVREFKNHAKARFTKDAFVEDIDFDFLEIEVLEEDW